MATFVLVPGAGHGGWWFAPLVERLREHGHDAHPVTLTGVGEQKHLLSGSVDLDVHIAEVIRAIRTTGAEDVVLCGHSYGGMVITGVADQIPELVDAVVYVDAFVPGDGESCLDLIPEPARQAVDRQVSADGLSLAPLEFFDPRATSHPVASWRQAIRLTGALETIRGKEYVLLCGQPSPFAGFFHRASADPTWRVHTLNVGHDVMREAPEELLTILLESGASAGQKGHHMGRGIETLAAQVRGPVLRPGDSDFDAERAGFQTSVQHRPKVIVGAESAEDVRRAVAFAQEHGMPVAVQATGHGLTIPAQGGVLISTRRMTGVRVDAGKATAWIEAGARWEHVLPVTTPHALAPVSGSSPHVGAVAYLLGGGTGVLARRDGVAADHLRALEVVTADGARRHVTTESDPDLFWALRGAGANFGVVTGVEVDLVRVDRFYGGGLFFDTEHVEGVLEGWRRWTRTVPETLTSSVGLIAFPDVAEVPSPLRGRYVAHVRIAFAGDPVEGERLVAPLRAVATPLIDTLAEMSFGESGSIYNEPSTPHGYCGSNVLLSELDASALRDTVEIAGPRAPVMCIVQVRHLGGAMARSDHAANAVGHRDAQYMVQVLSPTDGVSDGAAAAVHERLAAVLAPASVGRSVNFLYGQTASADQVCQSYEPEDYQRLRALKTVYDPSNTFRCNHNIPPAHGRDA